MLNKETNPERAKLGFGKQCFPASSFSTMLVFAQSSKR